MVMRSSSALGGVVAKGRALSDAALARDQSEQRCKGGIAHRHAHPVASRVDAGLIGDVRESKLAAVDQLDSFPQRTVGNPGKELSPLIFDLIMINQALFDCGRPDAV